METTTSIHSTSTTDARIRIVGADLAAETASPANSTSWGATARQVRCAKHAPNPVRKPVHFDEVDLAHELNDHSDDAVWMQLERMLIAREAARAAHPSSGVSRK